MKAFEYGVGAEDHGSCYYRSDSIIHWNLSVEPFSIHSDYIIRKLYICIL